MDFTVGIVSRNLATTSNFVEFRDNRNFTFFEAPGARCSKKAFERHAIRKNSPITCTHMTHVA